MKCIYKIILVLIILTSIGWVISFRLTSFGDWPYLEKIIQGVGMFLAAFTATIALAVADRKKEKIKVEIIKEPSIKNFDRGVPIDNQKFTSISDISEDKIKERYKNFNQPIKFYIVEFELINKSNFDWKNPTFTYETPINQRYLDPQGENRWVEHLPHTNYHNISSENYYYISGDNDIFSSIKLPYINKRTGLKIWFTLFLDTTMEEFTINISINCENAEGITKEIKINPKKLIENFQKR